MSTIRNIIFDLDGTLIDSSEGVAAAANHALKMMGLAERPVDEIARYIGYPLESMFADFTDLPYDELRRHFQDKAKETIVASTQPLPGAQETLTALAECGFRLAIASTKIRPHIEGIIDKLGWRPLLSAVSGGDEVSCVKPDPEIMHLTMKRMGADPGATMVVGDTVNDVLAALAAHLPVAAVVSPYGGREKLAVSRPTYLLDRLVDLLPLVGCPPVEVTRD